MPDPPCKPNPPYPQGPSSDSGGVVPFPIQGRFKEERQRLAGGFTDEDRAWRAQWLKDQVLHPDEPVAVPNYDKLAYNPIRRWGRVPLNLLFTPLKGVLGPYCGPTRHLFGRAMFYVFAAYWGYYYYKYNMNDWTSRSGWRVKYNPGACYPGDPEYPRVSKREKESDYGTQLTNCPL